MISILGGLTGSPRGTNQCPLRMQSLMMHSIVQSHKSRVAGRAKNGRPAFSSFLAGGTRLSNNSNEARLPGFSPKADGKDGNCKSADILENAVGNEDGLLLRVGEDGAWDDAGVGHPVVRYYLGDNEQRWFMWYTGKSKSCHDIDSIFPSSGSIGVAVSSDGLSWERGTGPIAGARGEDRSRDVGKIMEPNEDWWTHDTCHLSVSDVQILSSDSVSSSGGVYWCFYSGGDFEPVKVPKGMRLSEECPAEREGLRLRPGLALSQDGRNFARIEGDHHTGALFDVGKPGEWDELFIGSPQVLVAGAKDMRMYYHSYDKNRNRYVVGVATSPDGFKWSKQGPIFYGAPEEEEDAFDAMGAGARCVVRDIETKKYFMFYEGFCKDKKRSIGIAVSKDGMKDWKRCPSPVLVASQDGEAWDSGSVGTPWAASMSKGRWRLYYAGSKQVNGSSWSGIGVALSKPESELFEGAPIEYLRRVSK
eukprot:jgi/Picsp_1/4126/NSC_01635-R1_transcriptional regulator-like protein